MNIPRDFIELLLARIDIVDLINSQIPLGKKSGSNYFARCPFHNEKSASFSVSQPKQFYYCFGCGVHGNAIDFTMQHNHLSFPEAIETLARHAGVDMPYATSSPAKKEESLEALYALMSTVSTCYYQQMCQSPHAIHYLKERGISGNIAKQFQLGYAAPGWNHLLDTFGKSESEKKKLLAAGLIIKKKEGGYYDRFRDRIIFPIHDIRGHIIGFGGRIIAQGEPKYLNSPETLLFQKGHELYGLYQTLKSQRHLTRIIIVEGYMDVIALFQHHITYAVATLGTATTSHHLQRLLRYTSEIIFCFDGDNAGRTAAWRALQVIFPLMQDYLQIRFLFLPEGEDPDSLIRKEGTNVFEKRFTTALSLSAFFFQTLSRDCDLSTMEGRARFTASALKYIKQLPSEIFQTMMIAELEKRARFNIGTLKPQVIKNHEPKSTLPLASSLSKSSKIPTPARLALALLLQYPYLIEYVPASLPSNHSFHSFWYELLVQLIQKIEKNPNISTGMLLENWRGQKEEKLMAKLAYWEHMVPDSGLKNEFLGAIRQLILLTIDEKINRLLAKASQEDLADEEKLELSTWINKKKRSLDDIFT
jgi:DNA primase